MHNISESIYQKIVALVASKENCVARRRGKKNSFTLLYLWNFESHQCVYFKKLN